MAVTMASVGFAASLVLQERLMPHTRDELAGTLARRTSPATAMTLMAAASIAVTLTLSALDRRHGPDRVAPDLTEPRQARS